jgi:parvulin-like peptidyl-prolyl isomerase
MRAESFLLVLPLLLAPELATPAPAAPAKLPPVYAVLRSAPRPATPSCRPTTVDGEIRAALYSKDTGTCPVALVAADAVQLYELADALAQAHMAGDSKARRGAKPKGMDFRPPLERLIDVRLIAHEARDMGLTELPEFKQALEAHEASTLRTMLQKQAAATAKPVPADVDRVYKAAVKQWKIQSVLFEKEADAKAFREAIARGGSFDKLAAAAVKEKNAQGGKPGYVSGKQMLPELAHAANALQNGQVTQPVKVEKGFVVMKLEGVRYPKDEKVRAQATAQSLSEQQFKAVRRFHESLVKKYAVVDEKLLASLDLEAGGEAGFKALEKDQRPLAQIRGEGPITVADLTREVAKKFFHGIADPIKEKRVNKQKIDTFEVILGSRLFAIEAKARKLDETPEYQRKVAEYERVLAFDAFLQRVIIPDVKVSEAEAKSLYEKRKAQFGTPQMYRFEGLAFADAKGAQAAMEKLRAGTDLEFLRANGLGQIPPDKLQVSLDGTLLSVNGMPGSLGKALTGSKPGDYRLYDTDDGTQHYVLRVKESVAPAVRPYEDVREQIGRELEGEKVAAGIRDYAAKLRKVQKVDVIITRIAG